MKVDWMLDHTPKQYEYRYHLFDIDGRMMSGYNQRPASIRNAQLAGVGVWDCREHKLVIPVNVDKRLALLKRNREAADQKADEAFDRLQSCRRAVRETKVAG